VIIMGQVEGKVCIVTGAAGSANGRRIAKPMRSILRSALFEDVGSALCRSKLLIWLRAVRRCALGVEHTRN
jgi:hypothetical protein